MTVTALDFVVTTGGSGLTAFAYTKPYDKLTDLRMKIVNAAGVERIPTWNATGAEPGTGATMTVTSEPGGVPATDTVIMYRETSLQQLVDYEQGDFPSATHERVADRLIMAMQEARDDARRAVRVGFLGVPIPPIDPVANAILMFAPDGLSLIAGPTAQDVADAQLNAAAATAAAAAAALDADAAETARAAAQVSEANAALYAAIGGTDHSYLINTDFRIWERNTPLGLNGLYTGNAYGGPDQWLNGIAGGGTVTLSRGTFAAGTQLGIADPRVYLQQQVAGQAAAGDYAYVAQRINPVDRYQGRQITITGWACLPDGAGNIAVSGVQHFGTGGAPSASVIVAPVTVALGTSWQRFKATLNIPSITGKVRGTNDDEYLELRFWNSAGSTQDALTNALGLQNRRLCLWGLQVHHGDVAAEAADNFRIPAPAFTLQECQRFFQLGNARWDGMATNAVNFAAQVWFATPLRKVPVLTQANVGNTSFGAVPTQVGLSKSGFLDRRAATATAAGYFESTWQADAQL